MAANVIIHSDKRKKQRDQTLKDYGIDPKKASKYQKDMADCVSCKTMEVYATGRR